MRSRPYVAAVLATLAVLAPASTSTAAAVATAWTDDATTTARLRASVDTVRTAAGRETFYGRVGYNGAALTMARALARGQAVPAAPANAPTSYRYGATTTLNYDAMLTSAITAVVTTANAVITYPLHTDAGYAVFSEASGGLIHYGVVLIVGWPAPAVPTDTGCVTSSGYCWSTRGLNPHLPWTRNTVTWYLSTSHLPAAGETLVKTAIATLNKVSGLGADLVYGGKTSFTGPTPTRRFVVVWSGDGCASTALACTIDGTQGPYHLIYQARTVVMSARYNANPGTALWVGTLMHEIAHATGLGHFNGTYAGSYQLMRWADGPNSIKPGDANGLRRLAPPGPLTASLRPAWNGASYDLVVRAANTGLGGVRSIRTDCWSAGAWHAVASIAGRFDGRTADRRVGTAPAGSYCRAVVRSKASVLTAASVSVG